MQDLSFCVSSAQEKEHERESEQAAYAQGCPDRNIRPANHNCKLHVCGTQDGCPSMAHGIRNRAFHVRARTRKAQHAAGNQRHPYADERRCNGCRRNCIHHSRTVDNQSRCPGASHVRNGHGNLRCSAWNHAVGSLQEEPDCRAEAGLSHRKRSIQHACHRTQPRKGIHQTVCLHGCQCRVHVHQGLLRLDSRSRHAVRRKCLHRSNIHLCQSHGPCNRGHDR